MIHFIPASTQEVEALKELEERTVMEVLGQLCWEQWQNEMFGAVVGKPPTEQIPRKGSTRIFCLGILRGYRIMMDHAGTERYYR